MSFLKKSHLYFDIYSDDVVQIPINIFPSVQMGHTITLKARLISEDSLIVLYMSCPEMRDTSQTHALKGYNFASFEAFSDTPEYELSSIPSQIRFKLKNLTNQTSMDNAGVWLEFSFYVSKPDDNMHYKKYIDNPMY